MDRKMELPQSSDVQTAEYTDRNTEIWKRNWAKNVGAKNQAAAETLYLPNYLSPIFLPIHFFAQTTMLLRRSIGQKIDLSQSS